MEYSLSGFLSKLALYKLGGATNWKKDPQAIFHLFCSQVCQAWALKSRQV